jgi:tRNA (adenine22-N1)-methyltransferase
MEISSRLSKVVDMLPSCQVVADIGTDHGYVLIELLKRNKIRRGIASDNKQKPLEKAIRNAQAEGVADHLDFRLGSGLETLAAGEVEGVVIAGMGGILVKELLENSMDVVKALDFLLLQPAQNPDILRAYLYESDYEILDEELLKEDRRYYEYMMVRYNPSKQIRRRKISDYLIGDVLLEKGHPLLPDFIQGKITEMELILDKMDLTSDNARSRKAMIDDKINELRRLKDDCAG